MKKTDVLKEFKKGLLEGVEGTKTPDFDPTGAMEPVVIAIGQGEHQVIKVQSANKLGKTAHVVKALGEIMWKSHNPFFDYPLYKDWPYPKRFRLSFTSENAKDIGPLPGS